MNTRISAATRLWLKGSAMGDRDRAECTKTKTLTIIRLWDLLKRQKSITAPYVADTLDIPIRRARRYMWRIAATGLATLSGTGTGKNLTLTLIGGKP